ncbi:bifunctional transaldolase/phosoglucose isomerase [Phenylobacterium sp.]|uniref:bifunctional transaldolase/phosoglucose isomerase n=1 Tax=Phenylobacterium sp. TaxID=1871053 RepID=UPI003569A15A
MTNPLLQLADAGQSVWLDYLHRKLIESGELKRLIDEDGLKGMTSNPSIFEKAIGDGDDYDDRLKAVLATQDLEAMDLYEALAIADIQAAADLFRPVYDRLNGADGFVSLEVSPYLAMDTEATIIEARRLWRAVDRPNVMIKVPGTNAGVPAIRRLVGEGININVTLLFGLAAYRAVAEAHIAGLETFRAAGGDVSKVHGVASIFVSRIDTQIDKAIDRRLATGAGTHADELKALRGKVAIANAKLAYLDYQDRVASRRWKRLAAAGARPQRLLWASTGAKDPTYSDVLYVEGLIGPDTINTMPVKTLEAFRDHGRISPSLTSSLSAAGHVLGGADTLDLDLNGVCDRLVADGVTQFAQAFDKLLAAVADKRVRMLGERLNRQSITLPADLQPAFDEALERARAEGWSRRIWAGDAALWTGKDEASWLGWLQAGRGQAIDLAALTAFQTEVKADGFAHAVLLGMGGSSLAPEVLAQTFGARPGMPELLVLDSTDPAQIRRIEAQIDPAATLFIVSSKSGSTLEPDILHRYFFDLTARKLGAADAARHFIAVTDPGSKLEETAQRECFRRVFHGEPQIGGRYSALSNFGMVPAAVIGIDVAAFIGASELMARSCGPSVPPAANPGILLGLVLGAAAKAGRDKLSIVASKGIADLGAWLEQLIAESTGKRGKGLIPVDAEPLGAPGAYGGDRLFVYLHLQEDAASDIDASVREFEDFGHPVIRITLSNRDTLGQEFFRWEIATAVAGAVIGLNPFDQPDVEASKLKTKALTEGYEATGHLPPEEPILRSDGLALYADPRNADALQQAAGARSLDAFLGAHFERAHKGDYIGLLAYLDRSPAHISALQQVRKTLRDRKKVATVLGFGPRFQHSTGQAYKGGPNSGVFLQITAEPAADLSVPGHSYSFGVVEAAQARGDFDVLAERGRRLLRLDLGRDVQGGLKRLAEALDRSLA